MFTTLWFIAFFGQDPEHLKKINWVGLNQFIIYEIAHFQNNFRSDLSDVNFELSPGLAKNI